jgi:hypothetical protein
MPKLDDRRTIHVDAFTFNPRMIYLAMSALSPAAPINASGFIAAIIERTPNGEWISVQYHPDGDWSVARECNTAAPIDEDAELIERQFARLKEVEDVLLNGARFADDPECHPLYPHAVAARQILEKHIANRLSSNVGLREALEAERAAIVAFLRSEGEAARHAQASRESRTEKLYRMGQKDGLLLTATAIESGHHLAAKTPERQGNDQALASTTSGGRDGE